MVSGDTFDDFAPEPGGNGIGSVRVSDILARAVPIRWDEAVALLQEILETITTAGGANALVPAFEDIFIDREGTVTVNGSGRGERGPVAAARALHALLATADIPVRLRLFVTQANALDSHQSRQAFIEGLAYFGRPGRAELIRAIAERYTTSAPATESSQRRPDAPPPLPHTARADQVPKPRRTPARLLLPVAVGLLVASLAAVIWLGVFGGDGGSRAESAGTAAKAAGVTPLTTQQPGPNTPTAEREPVPDRRARPQTAPAGGVAGGRIVRDSSARSIPSMLALSPTSPAQTPVTPQSPAPSVLTLREDVDVTRVSEAKTIYSPADSDVEPPVMMYPSLPPAVFVARNADPVAVNRMELVIAADGSVERVRLVNGPTRMPDMMLLSGAKLWKFTPAEKDGVPVRYRTTVTWTGFP